MGFDSVPPDMIDKTIEEAQAEAHPTHLFSENIALNSQTEAIVILARKNATNAQSLTERRHIL